MMLNIVACISRVISKIHSPFSRKLITGDDYQTFITNAQIGDILLSRTRGELGNLFIPGRFTHAAIVDHNQTVIEATGKGVIRTRFFDFFRTKDIVVMLRTNGTRDQISIAVEKAISLLESPYDFDFTSGDSAYYCSELVNEAYLESGISLVEPKKVFGKYRIMPSQFFYSSKVHSVFCSRSFYED